MPRREPITEDQARAFRAAIRRPDLADWWDLATACGARPGELCRLDASRIAQDRRRATVEGKSGKRAIWFPDALHGRIDALCALRPSGPILLGYRDQPWMPAILGQRFRLIAKRSGVKAVPYHARSLFASRCYAAGIDHETIQLLLGHKPRSMLARHYLTIPESRLLAAVNAGWVWASTD